MITGKLLKAMVMGIMEIIIMIKTNMYPKLIVAIVVTFIEIHLF